MMALSTNEPCRTPQGAGRIVYWRYAPPDFNRIASVSVVLEAAPARSFQYVGTVYPAADVQVERGGAWVAIEHEDNR